MSIPWANIGSVLAALGTLATAGIAAWIAKASKDDLAASLAERRRTAAQQHRAQAVMVFASFGYEGPRETSTQTGQHHTVWIFSSFTRNASSAPIRNVNVDWHGVEGPSNPHPVLNSTPEGQNTLGFQIEVPVETAPNLDPSTVYALIEVTGAAGYRWRSWPDGRIQEQIGAGWVDNYPPPTVVVS